MCTTACRPRRAGQRALPPNKTVNHHLTIAVSVSDEEDICLAGLSDSSPPLFLDGITSEINVLICWVSNQHLRAIKQT